MKKIIYSTLLSATLLACGKQPKAQESEQADRKIVIYQVFTRLFGSDNPSPIYNGTLEQNGIGKFSDFSTTALDSIRSMGITHIWYTGIIEHASVYSLDTTGGNHQGVIKGRAGSPYAIKDYYDVNNYLADNPTVRMEEFDSLLSRTHRSGMKAIIDFVPNHLARVYHSDMAPQGVENFGTKDDNTVGFAPNNNFYYIPSVELEPQFDTHHKGTPYREYPAKVTGNDVFSATPSKGDWYETVKLNYGVDYQNDRKEHFDPIPDTWLKMRDILMYWAKKGVDGFRCDMAEMVPSRFWGWVVEEVKKSYPEVVFIAEIYNPLSYGQYIDKGKFDYLYDKVGLYDTLKSVVQGRSKSIAISQSRENVAAVQSHMLNFLENHDEQRIAWHEFAGSPAAGLPMMTISTLSDNIPMMIYFGQELGERATDSTGFSGADGRTTIFDFSSVASVQAWRNGGTFDGAKLTDEQKRLRSDYISILKLAQRDPFIDGEFIDLTLHNPTSSERVYAFARESVKGSAIVVSNLSPEAIKTTYTLPLSLKEQFSKGFTCLLNLNQDTSSRVEINPQGILSLSLAPHQSIVIHNP